MHKKLISVTGGSHGVRDEALLDAALSAPFISFDGTDLYPALEHKAARLGYGLIENYAMIDGNKRIGAHTMLVSSSSNNEESEDSYVKGISSMSGCSSGSSNGSCPFSGANIDAFFASTSSFG